MFRFFLFEVLLHKTAPEFRQNGSSVRPRPAGASLSGVHSPQAQIFPARLLGRVRQKAMPEKHTVHMLHVTYEDDFKIKNKCVAGISRTIIYLLKPSKCLHNLVRLFL
jgi:hypothetical protein